MDLLEFRYFLKMKSLIWGGNFGEKRCKLREASFFWFLCDSTHSNDGTLDRPRSWQPHQPMVVWILFLPGKQGKVKLCIN